MNEFIRHTINNNNFLLSASRCIFWEEEKALILSDLHLGKSGHFRKHGIAIPQSVFKEDMQRFAAQIQFFKPTSLIIVGDLFHSRENKEMDFFLKWRHDFPQLVIKGIAKQTLKFPCFYFNKSHAILPAFGRFTGTYTINKNKGDDVFALVENRVMKL